ncbi:MAG TPA: GNAT family N-acetyltransferase [Acidimicrobiales bacterium]|nr:GNAT family N-acetyltransferase [Acidimicrobiales bacterium]
MDDATATGEEVGQEALPPGYPAEWDADVVLADGSTVRIRPIRPDDGPRLVDFHGRQSPESIYFRYFSPHPRLSDEEVHHLTHVDYVDRMAFVALRGDVLVGVARYDRWPMRSEAEVAFFIDDAHRGRGMATLMLEYLAEAARRNGISAFTATVLPANRRMVGVFRAAGFQVRSTFEEGVIEVHLDLRPTPEAMAAIEARAQRAEAEAVRRLLEPRSIAVIGAGRDRHSVGHAVLRNLLAHGVNAPVHPVNRNADHVGGVPAVRSIADVEGPVDLAIVVVPAAEVPGVVEECGQKGVRAVIVISAGFAESGPEGAALSAATLRACRRHGMRLLGPNCLGVINTDPEVRLHATFATPTTRPGPVALLSESGTIGGALLDRIREAGLGASSFAAIGNRADVSANDMLQYWADDDRTQLVLLYLESFGNPRKFSRIARSLSRTKPIVAVKSGGAARAYPDDEVDLPPETFEALVEQTGIIRVDTLSQQLDVARLLACQPLPAGDRVALVGNGGGSLALAADACVDAGLRLATVGPAVREAVGAGGSGVRVRGSTVDLGFEATAEDLTRALVALLADDGVDSVLVVCAPAPRQPTDDLVGAVEAAGARAGGTPLVACVFGPHPPTITPEGGPPVPVFDFPDDAAYALGKVTRYAAWRSAPEGTAVEPPGADAAAARSRVAAALAAGTEGELPVGEAADLLAAAGLPMVPSRVAHDVDEAVEAARAVGFPVAVKAVSRTRLAKTEAGGLALDVHDEADVRATVERMAGALGERAWPVVVQPMAEPGVDVAVSASVTPMVGPVLAVGPGGVATAVTAAQVHVLPLTDLEARRFVADLPVAELLDADGRRLLEDLLLRVGHLVDEVPEIVGVELNPVIVAPTGAAIVDAKVRIAPVDRDPVPPVRRLAGPL